MSLASRSSSKSMASGLASWRSQSSQVRPETRMGGGSGRSICMAWLVGGLVIFQKECKVLLCTGCAWDWCSGVG